MIVGWQLIFLFFFKKIYNKHEFSKLDVDIQNLKEGYIPSIPTPKYIPVYIYLHYSIKDIISRNPNLISEAIKYTQQTFALHNIKIIIKEEDNFPLIDLRYKNLAKVILEFENEVRHWNRISKGIHVLFVTKFYYTELPPRRDNVESYCEIKSPTIVVEILNRENPSQLSAIVSRKIAHLFNGYSDSNQENCLLTGAKCIMNSDENHWGATYEFPPIFSSGTAQNITKFVQKCNYDVMLDNKLNIVKYNKCGNGIIDDGEQCDCGFAINCFRTSQHKCCDMSTCKLNPYAQCSHGECCDNCKLSNKLCRPSKSECDLDEFCDGKSPFCPKDLHRPDGYECISSSRGYCVAGVCPDAVNQCTQVLNLGALPSTKCELEYEMYHKYNCPNTPASNYQATLCDMNKYYFMDKYTQPQCGILFCVPNEHGIPSSRALKIPGSTSECRFTIPVTGTNDRKLSFIPNGMECEIAKMCLNNRCVDARWNKQLCQGIHCSEGMVCENGRCVSEFAIGTSCNRVYCTQDEVCDKYRKCIKKLIPENYEKYIPNIIITTTHKTDAQTTTHKTDAQTTTHKTDAPTTTHKTEAPTTTHKMDAPTTTHKTDAPTTTHKTDAPTTTHKMDAPTTTHKTEAPTTTHKTEAPTTTHKTDAPTTTHKTEAPITTHKIDAPETRILYSTTGRETPTIHQTTYTNEESVTYKIPSDCTKWPHCLNLPLLYSLIAIGCLLGLILICVVIYIICKGRRTTQIQNEGIDFTL